eukprot:CCRYP_010113-RH/>CCRYP_010113-RH protein AED:0.43 eAED:0.43 QI:0/-1/0/1/-1/0/1/0/74
MLVKSFPCDTSFSKWATHNHPHPFKPTTLRPWRCNQHHPTQAHQSHGHAFPLVALSYQPETFPAILARRGHQLS